MQEIPKRRNRVFKGLHKPRTILGIEIWLFAGIAVTAIGTFVLLSSLLAGILLFIGGVIFGQWVTTSDPAFLAILGKSEKFRHRYDAAKQEITKVEVR